MIDCHHWKRAGAAKDATPLSQRFVRIADFSSCNQYAGCTDPAMPKIESDATVRRVVTNQFVIQIATDDPQPPHLAAFGEC
jgi:hypothetical protein